MAYDFLGLVNQVNRRLNEVELTSSNFTSARGVQIQCKNAVNEAIRYINQREFGYSFNHATNSSTYVFQSPAEEYGMVPPPDKAYTVVYEYYRMPVDLILDTDVPTIPERFMHVITDGAMHYAYLFRGNSQDALIAKEKFQEGIKNMRSVLINRYDYVRSTALGNQTSFIVRI